MGCRFAPVGGVELVGLVLELPGEMLRGLTTPIRRPWRDAEGGTSHADPSPVSNGGSGGPGTAGGRLWVTLLP